MLCITVHVMSPTHCASRISQQMLTGLLLYPPADFTPRSVPALPVLQWNQVKQLSPLFIVRKLRVLLVVISVLFGSMHVIAGVLHALDVRDRREGLRHLRANLGFSLHPSGAWRARNHMSPLSRNAK